MRNVLVFFAGSITRRDLLQTSSYGPLTSTKLATTLLFMSPTPEWWDCAITRMASGHVWTFQFSSTTQIVLVLHRYTVERLFVRRQAGTIILIFLSPSILSGECTQVRMGPIKVKVAQKCFTTYSLVYNGYEAGFTNSLTYALRVEERCQSDKN